MHSYTAFEQYSRSTPFGATENAKVTGDAASADYQVVDASPEEMNATDFALSKTGANYHFHMGTRVSRGAPSVSSCSYDVELSKQ